MKKLFSLFILLLIVIFSGCDDDDKKSYLQNIDIDSVDVQIYGNTIDISWDNVDEATKYLVGNYPYNDKEAKKDSEGCKEYLKICGEEYIYQSYLHINNNWYFVYTGNSFYQDLALVYKRLMPDKDYKVDFFLTILPTDDSGKTASKPLTIELEYNHTQKLYKLIDIY